MVYYYIVVDDVVFLRSGSSNGSGVYGIDYTPYVVFIVVFVVDSSGGVVILSVDRGKVIDRRWRGDRDGDNGGCGHGHRGRHIRVDAIV